MHESIPRQTAPTASTGAQRSAWLRLRGRWSIALCGLLLASCNWSSNGHALTYSLGGSVNGLTASGLVLTNHGTVLDIASGATSFTFGPVFNHGDDYAISVSASPSGLTCSVASGVGTVGTSDVNNVVVTCSTQSFTLGGTITGLNSTGLVLANGTDTVAVPINATTFTLPTAVAYTSGYAVTVQAQPVGETCAVQNGVGVIPAANVTNVLVTCTDQPFKLGGTIAGLNGPGLVLANGSDTLTVAANATTFTMPTAVPYSTPYAVTIATPPPGLTCSVSNATGTMPAADVTNVLVTCSDQAFTLGGTVTGLNGTTALVLANGTDQVTVPVGGTTFTFPAAVAYTSPYAVTVPTPPPGLTCTVSGGTGTMPAKNVASVAVTCADQAFTLGGTISGLNGPGLVLVNGTDQLTVAANATMFSMPTGVAYTSNYDIKVMTQPPGEDCTVANGTGVMPAMNVVTVAITCVDKLYSLGGTVSGVTVAGLVLTNGMDMLPIPASMTGATAPFTMPIKVPFGSPYAITVQTQPLGLMCTVMNGSGTMPAMDVITVAVTCADQSFTLGGTITGLTVAGVGQTGLVLTNGMDMLNVPAGAATFTMPLPVAFMSPYAVAVGASPAGLMCSVSQGSGTMPPHNVTTVMITCSGQSYHLGGTISGLNGPGLVLANGADTDPIPSGATNFVMPMPVAFGSGYTITIKTPPPGLSCAVSNGTGTMPAGDVSNVSVTCTDLSFNVTGTVTGLTVDGLQLTNGGDSITLKSGTTTFKMPTPVAFGANYNVQVAATPAGLTCSVSGGSGVMPAQDVIAAVVCSDLSYTLGGTISGLNGSGLMLTDGIDTISPKPGDTSFTMPTPIAFMSPYNVTFAAIPAGENCTLSGGSGTMPASNVNPVAVSCTDQSFTVGGSITGLVTSGLILVNNGNGDTTAPNPGDTAFTMPQSVPFGSNYDIEIQQQPSGQTCAVGGANAGPMPAGNVTGVSIACL